MKKSGFVQVAFDFLILIHILDWKDVVWETNWRKSKARDDGAHCLL